MKTDINKEVGAKIRMYRKIKNMTLEDLSKKVYKSKSTISKYETGQIQIDVESLYAIADVFEINVEKLLFYKDEYILEDKKKELPAFFRNLTRLYTYSYDGRNNKIIRSRVNINSKVEDNNYRVSMYMNYSDSETYQVCENTYSGYIEHFDAKSNIILTNRDTPMEKAIIQIPASFLDSETKWSLWSGFSTRPMMPCASKMLISKEEIKYSKEFESSLKVNKEDIRCLRLYNMLSVV
ncbi:helix-turn-helix domain-containing protein [Anaerococcus kampingiae]|uniref:Helix-turn-helix domain-containing protein n=1 Tax=Anaerococcus kampingae TaxID=3115614 RepID=A0ABW9MFN7_9FIRM